MRSGAYQADGGTILIVAANPHPGAAVRETLCRAGYIVSIVSDATIWTDSPLVAPQVAILIGDDLRWIEYACSALRRRAPELMIVVLGPDNFGTRLRVFEVGADAYLVEPAAPGELLARISSLIRIHLHTT